jgi:hypothetical protein
VSRLLVTPVIALLSDLSVLDNLRPAENEVARIFDHLLEAILDPPLAKMEPLVSIGSEDWPYESVYHVGSRLGNGITLMLQAEYERCCCLIPRKHVVSNASLPQPGFARERIDCGHSGEWVDGYIPGGDHAVEDILDKDCRDCV